MKPISQVSDRKDGGIRAAAAKARGVANAGLSRVRRVADERRAAIRPPPELGPVPPIRSTDLDARTEVDAYWHRHTVRAPEFASIKESEEYLEWRFERYPLFREFSGLWGDHAGQSVLDYGCGPGNDVTGFSIYSNPDKVIGIDVSEKALALAAQRLALHHVDPERVELIHVSDDSPEIPLPDAAIDHLNCQGVIMITTEPQKLLEEFRRVMRPSANGCMMIYNRDSVWYHLYTAYQKMIVEDAFPGLDIDAAFTRNTDGPECPISRAWTSETFIGMCEHAGLRAEYVGGYPSVTELECLKQYLAQAIADGRLAGEHRDFLRALTYDFNGYPMYRGFHAGIGGVYKLETPPG